MTGLTPEEDAADALGSYNDAIAEVGKRVRAGAPVPTFKAGCPHIVVIDARARDAYVAGHIPGALSFP